VLRSEIARSIEPGRRASAFGAFHAVNGTAWFLGSVTMGLLYEYSLLGLAALSVAAQIAALVMFHRSMRLVRTLRSV
jgi:hypothetical protein